MTGHPITTAPAHEGVIAPFVYDVVAKSAVRVLGPDKHEETATWADTKQRGRNVGFERIRKGKKPRSYPRDAVEVRCPMAFVRRRTSILADKLFWDGVLEEP